MATTGRVNTTVYGELGERWYAAKDDPIALLRAEARGRDPWILDRIRAARGDRPAELLDVGCGAGFLANDAARAGHVVTGLDASDEALAVARAHDATASARYVRGDALLLPFADASFDVVCAMDLLEHVEDKERLVAEAARVLRAGGLFFFHTFAKNRLSWLVVIKGVEWFVKNTPKDLHVLDLFLDPRDLSAICARHALTVESLRGYAPDARRAAFWRMLATGRVDDDFAFRFTPSLRLGYTGCATKQR